MQERAQLAEVYKRGGVAEAEAFIKSRNAVKKQQGQEVLATGLAQ